MTIYKRLVEADVNGGQLYRFVDKLIDLWSIKTGGICEETEKGSLKTRHFCGSVFRQRGRSASVLICFSMNNRCWLELLLIQEKNSRHATKSSWSSGAKIVYK